MPSTDKQKQAALKYYYANIEKCKLRHRKWVSKNKKDIGTKQKESKRKRKLEGIKYLGGVCMICLETFHPAVYEFHHKDPSTKDRDPSKMTSLSKEKFFLELDKCDLLCANCHRLKHHGDSYAI